MKTYTAAALFAAAAVCAVAPVQAATTAEVVATANELLDVMSEMTSILDGVQDKAGADAAAPKIAACLQKLSSVLDKQQTLGEVSPEQRKEISENHADLETRANQVVEAMLMSVQRIMEEDCFGSEELMQALMSM